MVKVKYGLIDPLNTVLVGWWNVKGLALPFQRQVLATMRALGDHTKELDELRKKFVEDYAVKGEDGTPVNADGLYVFADPTTANARWAEIAAAEFDCPGIDAGLLEDYTEKLGLTIEQLAFIETILV